MLKKVVGLGPQRHCVFFHSAPNFYSNLKLIMSSLPQEKMFLYIAIARLEGPFLQEPGCQEEVPFVLALPLPLRSTMQILLPCTHSSLGRFTPIYCT